MFRNLIFLIILLVGGEIFAQKGESNFFSFSDTIFKKDQICRTYSIKFELAKSILKAEAFPFLDSVVVFLKNNPSLVIQVEVHSDNRTNPKCCDNPTQNRAEAIVTYLFDKGISKERMIPKGWGERKLLINDSEIAKVKTKEEKEKLHSMNRRVEFKIIGVN